MSQGRLSRLSFAAVLAASLLPATVEVAAAPPALELEAWPQIKSPLPPDPQLEKRIDQILAGLSLEEQVGQILQAEIQNVKPEDVARYHLGSILSGGGSHPARRKEASPAEWLALANAFYDASMHPGQGTPIPVFWGIDAVHGHNNVRGATIFPHNIGLGATRDPELIRQIGAATALEVAATGIEWTFAPTLAVVQDDRWGRTYEGYSEDPEIVASLGRAMIEGLQGRPGTPEFLSPGRVLATAKHFLGDGGTDKGRDQGDNLASAAELREIHGAGYLAALGAGVQTVMASYNSWHGVKMHGNGQLLTQLLKERLGFDGLVVGDWNGHGQVPGCSNGSCAAAINAGIDLLMVPEDWKKLYENTLEQVKSGEISRARLADAVRRNLRVKLRAGLFESGRPGSRPFAGKVELVGAPEHRAIAREAVRRSLVLLKNEGGLLPLRPQQKVLVAGSAASDIGRQCGGWTVTWQGISQSNADFPGATSIYAGIEKAVQAAGGSVELAEDGQYRERPDVAIVVFGEEPYAEFQGDLSNLDYHASHKKPLALLERLRQDKIPVVAVFLSGRPLWVNPELNAASAFVAAFLPGSEGDGVADLLFRKASGEVAYDFRGKLSYSWPRTPKQFTLDRRDTPYEPLFPLGFGLSVNDAGALAELPVAFADDGPTETSTDLFFSGRKNTGWQLAVTENDGPHRAAAEAMLVKVVAVDKEVQEDARQVKFPGGGVAGRVLLSGEPIDLERQANADLALSFAVLVESPVQEKISLGMGCGRDCAGRLDLTATLKALPAGSWQPVEVRLRCFAQAGADMKKIDTPFELTTAGPLTLRFADVRLVSAAGNAQPCP